MHRYVVMGKRRARRFAPLRWLRVGYSLEAVGGLPRGAGLVGAGLAAGTAGALRALLLGAALGVALPFLPEFAFLPVAGVLASGAVEATRPGRERIAGSLPTRSRKRIVWRVR